MTVRPRYTLRARAHDLHELGTAVLDQATVLAGAVIPSVRLLAAVVRSRTAEIITNRYTDPEDPR